ncbi:MAG: aminotransferase class I/II-fold pyridoxal phosphate-dependent enzyme [Alphaproteobacteria bacterium]|nr:aminotransferase class I/II-fold pyridoxal phosphate-dependent enzyme [Alphaproteobacteria bacterium]
MAYSEKLSSLIEQNRYRALKLRDGIDLSSNDYLGMATSDVLRLTAIEALRDGLDIGAAGSRLLRGNIKQHKDLEDFAASYYGSERALFFANGFQANFAILSTLPDRKDIILYDESVHASTRDGLSAGKAKSFKFTHNDVGALEDLLKRHCDKTDKLWVCVEALYSMSGDMPDLEAIYKVSSAYDATLIIDEAHSTGVWGRTGKGLSEGLIEKHGHENMIVLHACGKAIGVSGGIVCAAAEIIEYMINTARPFIYSTAPMPLQALLVHKSLEILDSSEGQKLRMKLLDLCATAKDMFGGCGSQIIPIMFGEDEKAMKAALYLQGKGYDIRAIRPPTVPEGTARLRLSLNTRLTDEVLQVFADALKKHDA